MQNLKKSTLIILFIILTGCSLTPAPPPVVAPKVPPANTLPPAPTITQEIQPTFTTAPTQSPSVTPTEEIAQEPVQGIILFIGDGMGANQRLAAQWLALGTDFKLAMDSMPVLGFSSTRAANRIITDSAAGGTAIASGVKANYRHVGLDPDNNIIPTILEQAKQQGWSTGLISTVQLAHATPATFAAHVDDRSDMTEIARQIIDNNVDVLLGGGENDFLPGGEQGCFPNYGHQPVGINPLNTALSMGYQLVCSANELQALNAGETPKLIGFFGDEQIISPFSPTLAEMTRKAIEILSQNENGFFLMVEAGQIDWAGHNKEGQDNLDFTVGLDLAVIEAQL
ncbi:MAG: alkaline phosphatase, partial [Chloroflexota bacterium]